MDGGTPSLSKARSKGEASFFIAVLLRMASLPLKYFKEGTITSKIIGISRFARNDIIGNDPSSLSLRGARQGDVAISTQESRRLLRSARNDIKGWTSSPRDGVLFFKEESSRAAS